MKIGNLKIKLVPGALAIKHKGRDGESRVLFVRSYSPFKNKVIYWRVTE